MPTMTLIQRYDLYTLLNNRPLCIDCDLTKKDAEILLEDRQASIFGSMPGISFEMRPVV